MSIFSIHSILFKEKTGSFDVKSGRGRKRIDSTIVEGEATEVYEELCGGVKPCSARWKLPEHWAGLLARCIKFYATSYICYPYKISHKQELFPSDMPARETFTLEFLACMGVDKE